MLFDLFGKNFMIVLKLHTIKGYWEDNLKQDENGRMTFEDGKIYRGSFVKDQMVDYTPQSPTGGTLNIGGEGNPVRQCIEIGDLAMFIKVRFF